MSSTHMIGALSQEGSQEGSQGRSGEAPDGSIGAVLGRGGTIEDFMRTKKFPVKRLYQAKGRVSMGHPGVSMRAHHGEVPMAKTLGYKQFPMLLGERHMIGDHQRSDTHLKSSCRSPTPDGGAYIVIRYGQTSVWEDLNAGEQLEPDHAQGWGHRSTTPRREQRLRLTHELSFLGLTQPLPMPRKSSIRTPGRVRGLNSIPSP